jgi:hypothetical protein
MQPHPLPSVKDRPAISVFDKKSDKNENRRDYD